MTKTSKKKEAAVPAVVYGDVMLDLETLGTRADAVILSIGAVKFNLRTGEIDDKAFYASVSIDSNHEVALRHISESTLIWWLQQTAEAQKVFSEEKTTLFAALEDLAAWFGMGTATDCKVWSNGADFDIPMLAHAFHTNHLEAPWRFYNARCFRTMKGLAAAKNVPKPANKCPHNALQDALNQAQWLIEINKVMTS